MRSIIIIGLFLIPALAFSQQKKDTKITTTAKDTGNLFNRVAMTLIDNGFPIEQKDKDLGYIQTGERKIEKAEGSSKIRAVIKDSIITFTSTFAINVEITLSGVKSSRVFEPVYYGGMKGSMIRRAWEIMDEIAKQFGAVSYSK